MDFLHAQKDDRVDCFSILATMNVKEYLDFVEVAYEKKGGIAGQRAPLKTKTAQLIRERMVSDLKNGAILPPVVLGVLISPGGFDRFESNALSAFEDLQGSIRPERHVTIIDGMQRTTALKEAFSDEMRDLVIRVEFWIAKSTNSLIYRMLVLNTGQVPWTLNRQIDIIFQQLKSELEDRIDGIALFDTDDSSRRRNPGEYQSSQFIELYILFGLRKNKINLQDQIADEFARLDFIQSASKKDYSDLFFNFTEVFVDYDQAISRASKGDQDRSSLRFKSGLEIFTSHPARIGFTVAFARHIFGRPGIDLDNDVSVGKTHLLVKKYRQHIEFLNSMSESELYNFIEFDNLNERIRIPSGKVGEFEREFFTIAFNTLNDILVEGLELQSYSPLWLSS